MFKIFPTILALVLLFSSCGHPNPKTVLLENKPFSYNVSISSRGKSYLYTLSHNGGNYLLTPLNNTVPIEFSLLEDRCEISNGEIQYDLLNHGVIPAPLVVAETVKSSIGEELSADYNGEYKHYGVCSGGEYCLTVDSSGDIISVVVENLDLKADFS